jgi:TolB-like protein/tetratricopeptide (TPR) repeat protein
MLMQPYTPGEVVAQVERILASRQFSRSQRLCRFLQFVSQRLLTGEGDQAKEQVIGVEVFDRKADYDPRIDPIVRVEARRLRAKLKAYYASSGRTDEWVVTLPKGGYAPVVTRRAALKPQLQTTNAKRNRLQSVAVLPFENLSAGDLYFSDGLTEELIHRLTCIPDLRVVAWNSTSRVRGSDHNLAEIRRLLSVQTIVRGSVRRAPGQVRVTAQLIDCESGTYLWSETYERNAEGVFEIQDDIARAIVKALQLKLAPPPQKPARKPPGLACYNLCLQGRFLLNKRTKEGLEQAAQRFGEATRLDDSSPEAYAGLADAHSVLAHYGHLHPSEALPRARSAAERALQLDPDSVEAHVSLAFVRTLFEWRWREGEALYLRAIRLNPGYSHAHHWYGLDYLALMGRLEEAVAEVRVALDLDPLSSILHEGLGYVQMLCGDFDAALATHAALAELDPHFYKGHSSLGRVLSLMGRQTEAIEAFERARALAGPVPSLLAALGQCHGLAGHTGQAQAFLEELIALRATRPVPETCFAILHLGLGNNAKALQHLESAADQNEMQVTALGVHPLYHPLRSEPGFQRLLERIGLLP